MTEKLLAAVIGLEHVTGLNTVWSLARMGVKVFGIIDESRTPLARTRMCTKVRCDNVNGPELVETLILLGKKLKGKCFLIPTSDRQVEIISRNREAIQQYYTFQLPEDKTVQLLLDKTKFGEFARHEKFATPLTLIAESEDDAARICRHISYPCILKPFDKIHAWDISFPNKKVLFLRSESDFARVRKDVFEAVERVVLQEWIPGPDPFIYFCLVYLDENSNAIASVVGRKIRQWPPFIGSTAMATIAHVPTLRDETLRLFRNLKVRGFASVEFKLDVREKSFKIIEPTVGRPNLQSYLAVANGVNVPYIGLCHAVGRRCQTAAEPDYARPIKWINEWADYESIRFYLKQGFHSPSEIVRSLRGPKIFGLLNLTDPMPFLAYSARRLGGRMRRLLG